jgi:ribonuclease E
VVRDLFNQEVERVVVDEKDAFERIRAYIADVTPDLANRMELYENTLPLFEKFHVVEQIRKALDRRVWLKSGGHIVIDRTEAMTVIDVNTGRYVGKSTLEETVLKTNLEAAEEVAKQLRLRDIGGIIVIDFIDMLFERNQAEVLRVLKAALAKDKTRTQVFGISELGLAQMTRKKVSEGLLEAFSVTCETCHGWGIVLTDIDT